VQKSKLAYNEKLEEDKVFEVAANETFEEEKNEKIIMKEKEKSKLVLSYELIFKDIDSGKIVCS